ncbi:MAG: glutamine--fructose-6-phosphate transaminase (isomerizing) [Halobacteriovoraceae bacterium]|jgi:glutamine---fructose-6-phosphate transaminase (isomerizing)|nr:glutamine--fructose-6-phosphate transaminase (isomerizing) [Halobacteriovoraceae bacterium]
MCGIVGHVGPKNSVEVVIEGLKRLEYRGYDSAGVSFINQKDELEVFKKEGKLQNLIDLLGTKKYISRSCIGHTRWATHGEVNDVNSHPHSANPISVVQNGIIENFATLKQELEGGGYKFESQTDTEVFLALIVTTMNSGKTFFEAVSSSFQRIDGNSAFVILNGDSGEILAIKRGAPLVCGTHDTHSQALVSSDPYALAGVVDRLYFPEDNVLISISGANKELIRFYELDGTPDCKRYLSKKQEMTLETSEKGKYEHFMLKEIYEQPGLVRALTQYYFTGDGVKHLEAVASLKPERVHVAACGTAHYAGMVVKDYIERINAIPCEVEFASEFRYRDPLLAKKDLGLFISQSGETADTLAAQELCQKKQLHTLSLVNVEGSTLFRNCDSNLLIRAGVEIGVASTKAFTQMALTGRLLAGSMAGQFKTDEGKKSVADKFSLLSERIDQLLARVGEIKDIAERIYQRNGFFFTGRGQYFSVALEGALKLKEIAYVHAEGYASGELKHGPIALIDDDMVNIAIVGPELYEKTVSNLQEIKARRGVIVTLGPAGDKILEEMSDYYIALDFSGLEELAPLYVNVANQLLAYYTAKFKGTDIDKPRNLAKSVTVE